MDKSLPGQLCDGIIAQDGTSEILFGLWLQGTVMPASGVSRWSSRSIPIMF